MAYKILTLNFGSTSSKIAYFEDDRLVVRGSLEHPNEELERFADFWSQEPYRIAAIRNFLEEQGIQEEMMDLIACWGGHCKPGKGGAYRITKQFLEQVKSGRYGHHPCDLAPFAAYQMAGENGMAISIDPPTIDEFNALARYTGIPGITRKSRMQTLNQKAIARKYAADHRKEYEECSLIVVHMGGGTSVVVHEKGEMVDANNGLDGDGPFATNRAGTVPAGDLIDLCYSGRYTHKEMRKQITGEAGLVAYLNENDVRKIEKRILAGDEKAKEVYDAMLYQTAKQIAASAAVLCGKVDAVLLTGGIANSRYAISEIEKRVTFIAPVIAYPGELEMQSLGMTAYRVLTGKEEIREVEKD